MVDFSRELGTDLTNLLTAINKNDSLSIDDIIAFTGKDQRFVLAMLKSLLYREYIMDSRGDWDIDYHSPSAIMVIGKGSYCISPDGANYLQLHRSWWKRFFVRSIICPIFIAFITALAAPTIISVFKLLLFKTILSA